MRSTEAQKKPENRDGEAQKPPKRAEQRKNNKKKPGRGPGQASKRLLCGKLGLTRPKSFDLGRFCPTNFTAFF